MGMPKKEVLPRGIRSRRTPTISFSQRRNLPRAMIIRAEAASIPQGMMTGTRMSPEKASCGTLSRIRAGRERVMANRLSTCAVSLGKLGRRRNPMPMSKKETVRMKFSMTGLRSSRKKQGKQPPRERIFFCAEAKIS